MSITIEDGGLIIKDPNAQKVYTFDWDRNLAPGVGITTSTFLITTLDGLNTVPLTKDNEVKLTAAQATAALGRTIVGDNRATQLRILAGTFGTLYKVENQALTDETPTQFKDKKVYLKVEDE